MLLEIIKAGREQGSSFARELYQLDDSTDFQYEMTGWLDGYLGELDIRGMHKAVCEALIALFKN